MNVSIAQRASSPDELTSHHRSSERHSFEMNKLGVLQEQFCRNVEVCNIHEPNAEVNERRQREEHTACFINTNKLDDHELGRERR